MKIHRQELTIGEISPQKKNHHKQSQTHVDTLKMKKKISDSESFFSSF